MRYTEEQKKYIIDHYSKTNMIISRVETASENRLTLTVTSTWKNLEARNTYINDPEIKRINQELEEFNLENDMVFEFKVKDIES